LHYAPRGPLPTAGGQSGKLASKTKKRQNGADDDYKPDNVNGFVHQTLLDRMFSS